MSVKFNVIQKGNPSQPTDPKKYYAAAHSSGEVTIRQLCKEIASLSTASAGDVMVVLESLIELVPKMLSDGKIVRLGDFGSFSVTIKSLGYDKASDVKANAIVSSKITFKPGKILKNAMVSTVYEKE